MAIRNTSRASGAVLALAIVAGAVIGAIQGQPSLGLLAGVVVGTAFALVTWLMDRAAGR